jgi:hypothetical protein
MRILLWILVWVGFGYLLHRKMSARLKGEASKLLVPCIAYFVLLGIFGLIYLQLYRSNHDNFVFAKDVEAPRRSAAKNEADRNKKTFIRTLSALSELEGAISSGSAVIKTDRRESNIDISTNNFQWFFSFDRGWSHPSATNLILAGRLDLRDYAEKTLAESPFQLYGPELVEQTRLPRKEWEALADSYFPPDIRDNRMRAQILGPLKSNTENALKELDTAKPEAEWNYFDFLYFSVITQTTVGYGDILPNSSLVRIAVMIQVLSGLLLMGVGLTFVMTEKEFSFRNSS